MPTASANGLTLAYELHGDPAASPLVLVMGLGMPLVFWPDAFVAGLAAKGFRVVCFDNRDCGHSEKLAGAPRPNLALAIGRSLLRLEVRAPYSLDDMARDVTGLLDTLGIVRAHVVGVSMGGMIGQVLAAHFPDRVTSLTSIMASSGNPRVSRGKPAAMRTLLARPDPHDLDAVVDHFVAVFGVIGSPGYASDPLQLRSLCERVARRGYYPAGTARQLLAILAAGDRRAELARVRAPTLVIHGTQDPLLPVAAGRDTARHIPGARLLELEGMGHDLPTALLPAVVDAIAQHCRAAEA
ncbi:MAG: alpha/beta fold hydrolase [Betaproteobacteria bacterium]|nr:alpha/beta fold hydrolase [Betaproteobacteria bacterium]